MKKSQVIIDKEYIISEIDRRIYGSFIEHLGRAVYEGIYQPESPFADEQGFRKDTLELVKECNVPIVRYPGGNFVSGFKWEDSVGPKDQRPAQVDLAWQVVESNQFGLNEFADWSKKAGSEVMMAVNLGTRGLLEAKDLLEYCNFKGGTQMSDLRRSHGYEEPHNIKTWCLGNEMDGPWQTGHKTALEYGRIANETGKAMKILDPSIELVACGSSGSQMPTFGEWEATVLDESYGTVDYVSMHQYYGNRDNDSANFLASNVDLDQFISSVISICDYVKGKHHGKKTINISLDEWNVWYHSNEADAQLEKWVQKPHQLEDVYNFEDALLVGSMLITMLRHADRVKIGCMTGGLGALCASDHDHVWKSASHYAFCQMMEYARGTSMETAVESETFDMPGYAIDDTSQYTGKEGVNYIDAASAWDKEREQLAVFAINRSEEEEYPLTLDVKGFEDYVFAGHQEMHTADLDARNTFEEPDAIRPVENPGGTFEDGVLKTHVKPLSWNVILFRKAGK